MIVRVKSPITSSTTTMKIQLAIALLLISTSAVRAQSLPIPVPPPTVQGQTPPPPPPPPEAEEPEEPAEDEPAEPAEEPAEPDDSTDPDETPTIIKPSGDSGENPLNPINAGELLRSQINADLWQEMKGELPCIEPTQSCIESLQSTAVSKNPLLTDLDTKIEEITEKIEEAKATNKQSIRLSVFEPALQYFLSQSNTTTTTTTNNQQQQQQPGGFLNNIIGLFTRPVGTVNGLLSAIGLPLLRSLTGGNDQQKAAAIAISDLSVKVAELQRGRAELANKIKEQVSFAVIDFDLKKREFQASLTATKLKEQQTKLIQVQFASGSYDAIAMLQQESSLNSSQLQAFREWGQLKAALIRLKLLVIGNSGEE